MADGRRLWGGAACAVVVATLRSSVASAAPDDRLGLHWTAPKECPSQAEIAGRALEIVGPRAGTRQRVDAEVVVSHGDADWRADIQLNGSTRSVQGESCSALGDAVAVIVALAVEHEVEPAPPREEPAGPPKPSSNTTSGFFAGAAVGAGEGILPSADIGPAIVAGWRVGHLRFGLDLGLTAKVEGRTAERPAEGATFWLARGSIRTCYTFLDGTFVVGPCAGFEVGRIAADGFGAPQPRSTSAVLPLGFGGLVAGVRLWSPFFLRATLDGAVPLGRPSFSVEGTGIVHRVSAVAIRGAAGLEVHF